MKKKDQEAVLLELNEINDLEKLKVTGGQIYTEVIYRDPPPFV
jgi:hypothetical protein